MFVTAAQNLENIFFGLGRTWLKSFCWSSSTCFIHEGLSEVHQLWSEFVEFHLWLTPEARRCYFLGGIKVMRAERNKRRAGGRGREDVRKGKGWKEQWNEKVRGVVYVRREEQGVVKQNSVIRRKKWWNPGTSDLNVMLMLKVCIKMFSLVKM